MEVRSVSGLRDIKVMNAIKVVLVAATNTVVVLCFAIFGSVVRRETLVMMLAAEAGGYLGAQIALRLKSSHIRIGIDVVKFMIYGGFLSHTVLSSFQPPRVPPTGSPN